CPLPTGVRLPAAAAAGDSGRLGRVRVPGDQRGHHQGDLCHGDNPAQRGQRLPSAPAAGGVTPPIRIESSASSVTEGQTLDLDCLVAGQGQATITWYKRGGSLPPKHQVGGDTSGVGDSGLGWLVDATTSCYRVPRFQGPACGCHSSQWPIRGSTCAGWTQAVSPARPPSLSPSPPVTVPATVSPSTG
ncbi:PGBM protein, partial [Pedionomus torquatus]|nr:PGBM protein [Pedionomus torquatus]